ncbi:hypothetical protein [Scytonema sp. UIC 10036]|uniref:hypothetical protein n=1 Tax=Scytonema sp. UIC 10036 TaxID=2304196 RepID=UPI00325C0DF2
MLLLLRRLEIDCWEQLVILTYSLLAKARIVCVQDARACAQRFPDGACYVVLWIGTQL